MDVFFDFDIPALFTEPLPGNGSLTPTPLSRLLGAMSQYLYACLYIVYMTIYLSLCPPLYLPSSLSFIYVVRLVH
jgi:hypothetical protein